VASLSQLRRENSISLLYGLFILGFALLLAACGGPNAVSATGTTPTPTPQPASVSVVASSAQLNSDGKTPVTLTVLVKDANNAAMNGQAVTLSADSGVIATSSSTSTTDATGTITATLNTSGDPTSRTINVTAKSGSVSGKTTVVVSGSTITVAGGNSIVQNSSTTLTIKVADSSGNAVANTALSVKSSQGNTLAAGGTTGTGSISATTNSLGVVAVTVTGVTAGADTLTFSAVGLQQTFVLQVSSQNFSIATPAANASIAINTAQTVTANWQSNGQPVVGQTVSFTTTRGTVSPTSATTDGHGNASTTIQSSGAGVATIQASAIQTVNGSQQVAAVATQAVNFLATSVARVDVQADKTILQIYKPSNPGSVATLTAVVRDSANNLVQGAEVDFTAVDSTGGKLSSPSSVTDSTGTATVTYTAGTISSAYNGVVITATVSNLNGVPVATPVNSVTDLTVGAQALFLRMGASNTLTSPTSNTYGEVFTVVVTDAAGNPVQNATVQFKWVPRTYGKGILIATPTAWVAQPSTVCASTDTNQNGILDPGEDVNGAGQLTPGNVASITPSATTDASGLATATLIWPKEYAYWVNADIRATVQVGGTEGQASIQNYPLVGTTSDFGNINQFPPAATASVLEYTLTKTAVATSSYYSVTPTPACTDPTQLYNFAASCDITDAANWVKGGLDQHSPSPVTTTTTSTTTSLTVIAQPAPSNTLTDSLNPCVQHNSSFGYCLNEVKTATTYSSSSAVSPVPASPFGFDGSCFDTK